MDCLLYTTYSLELTLWEKTKLKRPDHGKACSCFLYASYSLELTFWRRENCGVWSNQSPTFLTLKEPKNRFQGTNSARLCRRQPYSNSVPSPNRFKHWSWKCLQLGTNSSWHWWGYRKKPVSIHYCPGQENSERIRSSQRVSKRRTYRTCCICTKGLLDFSETLLDSGVCTQWGWRLEGWPNTAAHLAGLRRVTRQVWFCTWWTGRTASLFCTVPVALTGAVQLRADGIPIVMYTTIRHELSHPRKAWPGTLVGPCLP